MKKFMPISYLILVILLLNFRAFYAWIIGMLNYFRHIWVKASTDSPLVKGDLVGKK